MLYRLITIIGGLVFVAALFALVWFFCKQFLEHHGVRDNVTDRATVLATWTFAGMSVGLVFAVVGAFILGPWAFYRTLRGHGVPISDGAAVWWGFGIVLASLGITALGFFGFLVAVGAY
ncbi:hypothetical protein GCM10011533_21240 [Streptosporangium jomthongense]|uniref:Uncharacterized protein n=1 Tax=Marinobacter aromaticivorans TaxID=1494078 RepID=A0ABW2IVU2_9GAMM|nr:hypothetical protein [Marinobacter aromaticivorans]GGE68639.1 hypothetical protein GCM10011533_21240 [Streptosporangium jomthongense]